MKVLIVDDEYDKASEICAVLENSDINCLEIFHETTAAAARRLLQSRQIDMLIIDLHLPETIGVGPNSNGGLDLFDLISIDQNIIQPTDVLFITGREELLDKASKEVIKRGGALCQYRKGSDDWKEILAGRVKYLGQRLAHCEHIDIAVITALRSPELDAVLNLPYNWKSKRYLNDPLTYHFGHVPRSVGRASIVCASPNRKGMPSSSAVASKLAHTFRPKYIVMLGICAGIQGKCNLGDVIVADPTWDWGSGKRGIDTEGSPVFQSAPYQMPLNNRICQIASDMSKNSAIKSSIKCGWTEAIPEGVLSVHIGPMASGASVIADDHTARLIGTQNRELLAIEMEAYAVMSVTEYANDPKPTAIIIKSVCDFADSNKNNNWQKYASYTSAAFADQLFRNPDLSFTR